MVDFLGKMKEARNSFTATVRCRPLMCRLELTTNKTCLTLLINRLTTILIHETFVPATQLKLLAVKCSGVLFEKHAQNMLGARSENASNVKAE